ncbi:MAG: MFS transporter [Pseudomonadota bacterium]
MTATTLRLLYALSLGSLGAIVPYLAVELVDAGLPPASLGLVLLAFPVGRFLSGPLAAWLADRFHMSGALLAGAWSLAAAAILLLLLAHGTVAAALALTGYTLAVSTFGPILDGMAVTFLGGDRARYGRFRLWGSAGYLVMVLASGLLRDFTTLSPLVLGAALLIAAAAVATRLRDLRTAPPPPVLPALRAFLTSPGVAALLIAATLHTVTLTGYDLLFAAHVTGLGLPSRVASWAVASGVAVEVGVLAAAPLLLRRVGPERLLAIALASGMLRWGLTAVAQAELAVVLVQALHGITFGAFWIAAVHLLSSRAPVAVAASAQSLLYLSCWGVGGFIGIPLATQVMAQAGSPAMFVGLAGVSLLATGVWVVGARGVRARHPIPS